MRRLTLLLPLSAVVTADAQYDLLDYGLTAAPTVSAAKVTP